MSLLTSQDWPALPQSLRQNGHGEQRPPANASHDSPRFQHLSSNQVNGNQPTQRNCLSLQMMTIMPLPPPLQPSHAGYGFVPVHPPPGLQPAMPSNGHCHTSTYDGVAYRPTDVAGAHSHVTAAPAMYFIPGSQAIRPPPGLLPPQNAVRQSFPTPVPAISSTVQDPRQASSSSQHSRSTSENFSLSKGTSAPTTENSPAIPPREGREQGGAVKDGPLDRYAASYIPAWLRQINLDSQYRYIPLPEEPNYDYDAFVSSFLPRKLIFSDPDDDEVGVGRRSQYPSDSDRHNSEELVKVDASWLKEDDALLNEELEVGEGLEAGKGTATQIESHHSIGALSQDDGGMARLAAKPAMALLRSAPDAVTKTPIPPLRIETYTDRFSQLLKMEYTHRQDMLAAQSLFDVQLTPYPNEEDRWSNSHLYSLSLPGVREDYPNLITGDRLQLRALASESNSWLRLAFEAKVYVVHKVAGLVVIKCDALGAELANLFRGVQQARFNVLFTSSALRGSIEILVGIERIGKHLLRKSSTAGETLRRWLFPTRKDARWPAEFHNKLPSNLSFYDDKLNCEQREVVQNILSSTRRTIPYLIHGPPGTGKTKTLVETTLQILKHQKDAHILLTAPSVTAADTLALRLASHLGPTEMTRINDARRTFEEVPERLLMYCTIDEAQGSARFGLPDWERLMKTRVVIMATHDIHILHLCKISNLELGRWQGTTIATMLGSSTGSAKLHWTHLLVDEAGQSHEAEMASALLLVAPSVYHDTADCLPVVVLCGDVAQLGPQIDSHFARSHGLDISLLERLSKRKAYRLQLSALRKQARQALMRGDYGPDRDDIIRVQSATDSRITAAHLVRNYRARNPSLLHVVSMLFYDDCLLPCAPPSTINLSTLAMDAKHPPLLFHHINCKDDWVDEGASFYNAGEIDQVVDYCKRLTERGTSVADAVRPKDIAVITPYREQVWRIRLQLRNTGLAAVSVGNVEVYQGAEHRVTILSTVRSSARFLDIDAKRSLGLMMERKRMCVALSRAQEALIVVGNADLLRLDPYWRTFLSYANRNSAVRGMVADTISVQDLENEQVGALEYAARISKAGKVADDYCGMALLAGRVAATALYEDEEDTAEDDDNEEGI